MATPITAPDQIPTGRDKDGADEIQRRVDGRQIGDGHFLLLIVIMVLIPIRERRSLTRASSYQAVAWEPGTKVASLICAHWPLDVGRCTFDFSRNASCLGTDAAFPGATVLSAPRKSASFSITTYPPPLRCRFHFTLRLDELVPGQARFRQGMAGPGLSGTS